jgi:hypothetical protein
MKKRKKREKKEKMSIKKKREIKNMYEKRTILK